jgi:dimeric dUTPase (all-alpha-NTP-PPase superfamily)
MELETAKSMLRTMASMQEEHNIQVHADWRTNGYEFYRAIWVECAEMLDHFGWKWWKKQEPDMDQVKLELVDVWHFALSELIRSDNLSEGLADDLRNVNVSGFDAEKFRKAIEGLALSTLQSKSFEMAYFLKAMETLPLELEELFTLYIGKNVLNRFRQAHGYQEGSYRKEWSGREDNEHLIELMQSFTEDPEKIPDLLYQRLVERYFDTSN